MDTSFPCQILPLTTTFMAFRSDQLGLINRLVASEVSSFDHDA